MKATAAVALLLVLAACKSKPGTPEEQQAAKDKAAQQEAAKQDAAKQAAAKEQAAKQEAANKEAAKKAAAEKKKQDEENAKYAPYPDPPAPHVQDCMPKESSAKSDQQGEQQK